MEVVRQLAEVGVVELAEVVAVAGLELAEEEVGLAVAVRRSSPQAVAPAEATAELPAPNLAEGVAGVLL